MSVLSWGKPKITTTTSTSGAPGASATWAEIATPKENTTKLTPTSGTEKTATEEGGAIVDFLKGAVSFVLEFDVFVKKGVALPFSDIDGVISGEHAFRVVPEDNTCEGIQIDRAVVSAELSYSAEDGKLVHYVVKCLKPASGATVKAYTEGGLTVDKSNLYFASTADSTGKTVTATSTGNVSATSDSDWCTVTCSAKVATVKVTANSTGSAREATVTITADSKSAQVSVLQIPA